MAELDELRADLADIAASLRAYLEQQAGTGATGIPRGDVATRAAAQVGAPSRPAPAADEDASTPHVANPAPRVPPPAAPAVGPVALATPVAVRAPAAAASVAPGPSRSGDPAVRLPQLAAEIASCTRCVLSQTRTQTVFARGNPASAIVFVGEAPGADEDAQGLPFVGRAGQLLDRMIQAMGLSPENDVYIVNILRCRPPGNRKPEPEEIASCLPYLHEQLELVKPKVLVALGNTAVGTLLGTTLGITKLRGQWKLYRGTTLVMPTYHPSYLLRPSAQQTEAKRQAWEDLQAVMRELQLPMPSPKKRGANRTEDEP